MRWCNRAIQEVRLCKFVLLSDGSMTCNLFVCLFVFVSNWFTSDGFVYLNGVLISLNTQDNMVFRNVLFKTVGLC